MRFRENADVLSADGEKIGEMERVVLDPEDQQVTHIVVRQGFLFATDKILPANLVQTGTEERVILRLDADELEHLPDFKEKNFVPLHEKEEAEGRGVRSTYWYPPAGTAWGVTAGATLGVGAPTVPPYVVEEEEQIPEGTVALQRGATVVSSDGEKVGSVKSILTEPDEHRATHLVIARGLFFQEEKLIPTIWIAAVMEDEILLTVTSETLQDLPEYEATF
ncbi:MAG: PRC-barrel domain-containing protein [Anaerolineales bacterium]